MTVSQLESWRRIGLLPRHRRRGLGRGRGSVVDEVDPAVVAGAAALARHLGQGRDRRLAVLAWFAEAGTPQPPGAETVPEPPMGAVRQALEWALRGSVSHRLLDAARSAAEQGEEGMDAFYTAAGRLIAAHPHRGAAHPALVREALLTDEALPQRPNPRGMVHLVAAMGLGAQEVGPDALGEAFAAWGMYGLTAEDWARILQADERGEGLPVDWELLRQNADTLGPVRQAGDEELVRARTVAIGLRPFYALYTMHGLLMPDTPALAALRQRIDERAMGPLLDHLIGLDPSPTQFAEALTACLQPHLDELYEALMQQAAADPNIFHLPGDDTGATGFMQTWLRALHEQTAAGQETG